MPFPGRVVLVICACARLLFAASAADWADFAEPIRTACAEAGLSVDLSPDPRRADADYIIFAPSGRIPDFAAATRTRAVLSLWAGVERIVTQPA